MHSIVDNLCITIEARTKRLRSIVAQPKRRAMLALAPKTLLYKEAGGGTAGCGRRFTRFHLRPRAYYNLRQKS